MTNYLVATAKPWNAAAFERNTPGLPGNWQLITRPEDLTVDLVERLRPRYIFFPHWSWKVPPGILERAECVCFHMADVPYGRGGSPLQNLIARGHRSTMLSALRMVEELDAGPVYLKRPLDLAGRAQEVFERAADLTYAMIAEVVHAEPEPAPQAGEAVVFPRRTPEMSRLPEDAGLAALYDHIRMLDAETYPPAYLDYGRFRLELRHAAVAEDAETLRAEVVIRPASDEEGEE